MAFDAEKHDFDDNGFMIDRDTGHRIGLEPAPRGNVQDEEWPKWVEVHESHLVRSGDGVVPPEWPEFHVRRDGVVTVLVKDEGEERRAVEPKAVAEPEHAPPEENGRRKTGLALGETDDLGPDHEPVLEPVIE